MRVWSLCVVLLLILCNTSNANINPPDERYIVIDLWKRELRLIENDHIRERYPIAPGTEEYPSPIGEWIITNKSKDWGGGFGTRWIGLNVPWGIYGIHGTNLPHTIGQDASHGCFRMFNSHIEQLFPLVSAGMRVVVDGPLLGRDEWMIKKLVRGSRNSDVMLVQNRLRSAGYYDGPIDGIFGYQLEEAVKQWQQEMNWEVTAQIGLREYLALGLIE